MLSLESEVSGVTSHCGGVLYHRYQSEAALLRLQAHEGYLMIGRAGTARAEETLRLALWWLLLVCVRCELAPVEYTDFN